MKIVKVLESSAELFAAASISEEDETAESPRLNKPAKLVFSNDFQSVRLVSEGFALQGVAGHDLIREVFLWIGIEVKINRPL